MSQPPRRLTRPKAVVTQLLVSTLFLTTKHTWNLKGWTRREDTGRGGNGIDLPEIDIYNYIQQVRFAVFTWMGEAAEHYPRKFQTVLNTVNREVANGDDRDLQWGCIRSENPDLKENLGRYGIDTSSKSADGRVTSIVSGTSVVQLNFQTMQMIVNSNVVSALDSRTANHWLVVQTLQRMSKDENNEKTSGVKQCMEISKHEHVTTRFLLTEQLVIESWTGHETYASNSVFSDRDRGFPDELCVEEEWIRKLFMPIHKMHLDVGKVFTWNPKCKPHVQPCTYSLPEEEYSEDDRVAVMTMHQPLIGKGTKRWKEIVLLRDWNCVNIYSIIERARRYFRCLEYSSDARYSLCELQPGRPMIPLEWRIYFSSRPQDDVKGFQFWKPDCDPSIPWPKWGRHEGYSRKFIWSLYLGIKYAYSWQKLYVHSVLIRRAMPEAVLANNDRAKPQQHHELCVGPLSELRVGEQCLFGYCLQPCSMHLISGRTTAVDV